MSVNDPFFRAEGGIELTSGEDPVVIAILLKPAESSIACRVIESPAPPSVDGN